MERHGTFSSSNIWKLMTNDKSGKSFGAPAIKYIRQVQHELRLGRAINREISSHPTSWGLLCEKRVHDILPLEYSLVSSERLFHPSIPFYSGAPDLKKEITVADVKCPHSLEVFCDKLEALNSPITYKSEFPEDYWQHLSNAILLEANGIKTTHFEAIIYCPYISELKEIRELASNYDGADQSKYAWINFASDNELPYLIEGKHYKNLNVIRWEIFEPDKKALTDRVIAAGKLLQK